MSEIAIGIDLGTTNTCVGIYRNGKTEIIPNAKDNNITPSYVSFTDEGTRIIGEDAKNNLRLAPEKTIFDAKRLIGRKFNDSEIYNDIKKWPFTVLNEESKPKIEIITRGVTNKYFPEQISGFILEKIKEESEVYLGQEVSKCVITVPAHFNDSQRQATINAGRLAGLNVIRIINEPTAAAIAYTLNKRNENTKYVLIYDLGGGTFDVSIVKIKGTSIKVLSTGGNTHLGGVDFDNRIMDYVMEEIKKMYDKDVTKDKIAIRRLRSVCEKVKIDLTTQTEKTIAIDELCGVDVSVKLTRQKFEELNAKLFESTIEVVTSCLKDARLDKTKMDEIVLVGGSTRIPKIRDIVCEFFNGKKLNNSISPDETVAHGAAIQAAMLLDSMSKEIREVTLSDVLPNSLGIEIIFGRMSNIIPKNTQIPTSKTEVYYPTRHHQTTVEISVYEGEKEFVSDNNLLGQFSIGGFPSRPINETKFEVTFDIDENGILTVKCKDRDSAVQDQLTILHDKGDLSPEDIKRMREESEIIRQKEAQQKSAQEEKNKVLEHLKVIKYRVSKENVILDESDKSNVLKKCEEIKKFIDNTSQLLKMEEYKAKYEEIDNFFNQHIPK